MVSFLLLPAEIRLKIWKLCCLQSRNITILSVGVGEFIETNPIDRSSRDDPKHRFITYTPVPALLHTCKESRHVGLQYYELSFGRTYDLRHGVKIEIPHRIYVNWISDCILPVGYHETDKTTFDCFFCDCTLPTARYIAVDASKYIPFRKGRLSTMGVLEEIILYYPLYPLSHISFLLDSTWEPGVELFELPSTQPDGLPMDHLEGYVVLRQAEKDLLEELNERENEIKSMEDRRQRTREKCIRTNRKIPASLLSSPIPWSRPSVRIMLAKPKGAPIGKQFLFLESEKNVIKLGFINL